MKHQEFRITDIFSIEELCGSATQVKKMLSQGGLYMHDGEDWFQFPPNSVSVFICEDTVFRAGKRKFLELVFPQ